MLNRHARAGLVTALLTYHDGTCELLPKPPFVRLFMEDAEAIEEYLSLRQDPDSSLNPAHDFQALQSQVEIRRNHERTQYQYQRFQNNDLICRRKGAEELIYLKVLFDDYQRKKNYRPNQREKQGREFLRTYAGLARHYQHTEANVVHPILGILSSVRHEVNTFLPQENVFYGERFCRELFPTLDFQKMEETLQGLGDDPEIVQIFDGLYQKIRYGGLGKQLPEADPVTGDDATGAPI